MTDDMESGFMERRQESASRLLQTTVHDIIKEMQNWRILGFGVVYVCYN